MRRAALALPVLWLLLGGAAPPLSFTTVEPRFADSADEYRKLWQEEGGGIVAVRPPSLLLPTAEPGRSARHEGCDLG